MEHADKIVMSEIGRDSDFEGLHAPNIISERHPNLLPTGRNVHVVEILNDKVQE